MNEVQLHIREVKKEVVRKQDNDYDEEKWRIKAENVYQEIKVTITTEHDPELKIGDKIILQVVRQQQTIGGAYGQEE